MSIIKYLIIAGLFFAAIRWALIALLCYCGMVLVLNLIFRPSETWPIAVGLGVTFLLGEHPAMLNALLAIGLILTLVEWWRQD